MGDKDYSYKVSIIIPIHEIHIWLNDMFNSIKKQDYSNIEIVIVCSNKIRLFILNKFNIKFTWVSDEKAKYAGEKRNLGIKNCNGDLIIFLDSDDFLYSNNAVQLLVNEILKNNIEIAGGSCLIKNNLDNSYILRNDLIIENSGLYSMKEFQNESGFYRFIYKKQFLLSNNLYFSNLQRFQDSLFLVKVLDRAKNFSLITNIIYVYRKNHKTLNWTFEMYRDHISGVLQVMNISMKKNYQNLLKKMQINLINTVILRKPQKLTFTDFFKFFIFNIKLFINLIKLLGFNKSTIKFELKLFIKLFKR